MKTSQFSFDTECNFAALYEETLFTELRCSSQIAAQLHLAVIKHLVEETIVFYGN